MKPIPNVFTNHHYNKPSVIQQVRNKPCNAAVLFTEPGSNFCKRKHWGTTRIYL